MAAKTTGAEGLTLDNITKAVGDALKAFLRRETFQFKKEEERSAALRQYIEKGEFQFKEGSHESRSLNLRDLDLVVEMFPWRNVEIVIQGYNPPKNARISLFDLESRVELFWFSPSKIEEVDNKLGTQMRLKISYYVDPEDSKWLTMEEMRRGLTEHLRKLGVEDIDENNASDGLSCTMNLASMELTVKNYTDIQFIRYNGRRVERDSEGKVKEFLPGLRLNSQFIVCETLQQLKKCLITSVKISVIPPSTAQMTDVLSAYIGTITQNKLSLSTDTNAQGVKTSEIHLDSLGVVVIGFETKRGMSIRYHGYTYTRYDGNFLAYFALFDGEQPTSIKRMDPRRLCEFRKRLPTFLPIKVKTEPEALKPPTAVHMTEMIKRCFEKEGITNIQIDELTTDGVSFPTYSINLAGMDVTVKSDDKINLIEYRGFILNQCDAVVDLLQVDAGTERKTIHSRSYTTNENFDNGIRVYLRLSRKSGQGNRQVPSARGYVPYGNDIKKLEDDVSEIKQMLNRILQLLEEKK